MAIREDLEQEDRSELRAREGVGSSRAEVTLPLYKVRKCPYLAGRPPCGTHHLFPSGANVCWARTGDAKPYLGVSREAQDRHCFGGPEGQDRCEQDPRGRHRRSPAATVPARPAARRSVRARWALPPRPKPRRRAEIGQSPLKSHLAWLLPLILTGLLLALLLR